MNKTLDVTVTTKDALHDRINKMERFQLLNVMDPQSYSLGVIKGSKKIPLAELEKRYTELDKTMDIVTYCAGTPCNASRKAAEMLAEKGYKTSVYEGGIKEWTSNNLPVETTVAPVNTPTTPVNTRTTPVNTGTTPVNTGTTPVNYATTPVKTGTKTF